MFDFLPLRKTLSTFVAEVASLRGDIERLQREREDIITAPATRQDMKAAVDRWVSGRAAEYVKKLRFNMGPLICKPESFKDPAVFDKRMTLFGTSRQLGGADTMFPGPELEDMAICALVGPALTKALHEAIDAMDWPENSRPMAGREDRLASIDSKLAKLVEQEEKLTAAARESGITLDQQGARVAVQ